MDMGFQCDIDDARYGQLDHDTVCVIQAGQLLDMNCLEYETAAYGLVYRQNKETYYYISSRKDTMQDFIKMACMEDLRYTPVKYYFKRFDVIEESEEEIKERFRIEIAQRMYEYYPEIFFDALEDLTSDPCANAAFPVVEKICQQLENSFDLHHLDIFSNLLELLLQSRLLSKESYQIFTQWLHNEYEKSSVEPISSSIYRRTYAGFAYEKPNGDIGFFADAVQHMAIEKRDTYIAKGYCVTPILSVQYYGDTFQNLQDTRKKFLEALKYYFDENYMAIMKYLRSIPSGIDTEKYHAYEEKIKETGKEKAIEAFRYYGYLWNVL